MHILVIDDRADQRQHALNALSEHDVTVADGWKEGDSAIKDGDWDVVLTDLSMPAVRDGQGHEGRQYVGEPTPYGFPLALLALKKGVEKVAVVSNGQEGPDGNHHSHPIFWASDDIHGVIIPGRLWAFTGYRCPSMDGESVPGVDEPYLIKDWKSVLDVLLTE